MALDETNITSQSYQVETIVFDKFPCTRVCVCVRTEKLPCSLSVGKELCTRTAYSSW